MIYQDRISKLKRYLSDWKEWGVAAAAERDRLLKLSAFQRDVNGNDIETSELLQQRIQSLDAAVREFQLAELRITHALGRAEARQE